MIVKQTMLTSGEAAKMFGVSRETINRWANQGVLPCVRLPSGHRRFTYASIESAVEQMMKDGAIPDPYTNTDKETTQ